MLHPDPRNVAFIGLATGISAGAALDHPGVDQITATELSPLVVAAAKSHFGSFNRNLVTSPRSEILVEDGRIYIASTEQRFDVVVGDLFLPWNPGVGRLYSLEHFRSVRRALKARGLFCQWLPMHQLTSDQMELITDTFSEVFPSPRLFAGHLRGTTPYLAMVGHRDPVSEENLWQTVGKRCTDSRENDTVADPLLRHPEGLALLYLGTWEGTSDTSRNTLQNGALEVSASRERLSGQPGKKYFFMSRWVAWCERQRQTLSRSSPGQSLEAVSNLGQALMLWEVLRLRDSRSARSLERQIKSAFPLSIRNDETADWNLWAGSRPNQGRW